MTDTKLPTPEQMRSKVRALNPIVNTYMMAKAFAQMQREAVDKIERKILSEGQFFADRETGRAQGQRITEPKLTYLMLEVDLYKYLSKVREELESAGYRIKQGRNRDGSLSEDSWNYCCPALVAEELKRQAARVMIDLAAKEFSLGEGFFDKLVCSKFENYEKFIGLVCGMVVNHPAYKKAQLKAA